METSHIVPMPKGFIAVRILQIIFAVIVAGLTAFLIANTIGFVFSVSHVYIAFLQKTVSDGIRIGNGVWHFLCHHHLDHCHVRPCCRECCEKSLQHVGCFGARYCNGDLLAERNGRNGCSPGFVHRARRLVQARTCQAILLHLGWQYLSRHTCRCRWCGRYRVVSVHDDPNGLY